jgi:Domain of unknown function (DUF4184)
VPFTFSHPAAVLPLRRSRLVFSALVVGSMAPDFEYFFRLTRLGHTSHTFPGVLTFTFPVALAVLFLFHAVVKWPLISLLPRGLQSRLVGPARQFNWGPPSRFLLILGSLAVGISTHIACDGFTHPDGWAAMLWPGMRVTLFSVRHHPIAMFKLLQYGCTVLGAFVLTLAAVRWYRRAPQEENLPPQLSPAASVAICFLMITIAVTAGAIMGVAPSYTLELGLSNWLVRSTIGFVTTTTSAAAFELFGFSLIWRFFLARNLSGGAIESIRGRSDCS